MSVAGELVQIVKYLPYKHEDPNLIPRTHVKKSDLVAHAYKASIGEAGTGV